MPANEIPLIPYRPDMGRYSEEIAKRLRDKTPFISSMEDQMKRLSIRKSEKYKDGFMKCQHSNTLFYSVNYEACVPPIRKLIIDQYGTLIGINLGWSDDKSKYLLVGQDNDYLAESIISGFFGIEIGDEIYQLVASEEERNDCLECKECFSRPCSPWGHQKYFDHFGHTPDRKELLSWNFMEMSGPSNNYAHLIATRGLAVVPFVCISESQNANQQRICFYSDSYLKKWLNTTFLQEYFSEEERKYIRSVDIPSSKEIEKWFPEEHDRICIPTQFAIDNNAVVFENNDSLKTCVYWLSDTGRKVGMSATVVLSNGKIYKSAYMAAANVCVRPVIEVVRKEQW